MDLSQQKEQFSIAFVHAVASAAGFKLFRCDVDDESVDITIGRTAGNGTIRSPRLDVQLKCTKRDVLKTDGVHLQLKRKNYDDLRTVDNHFPHILVVLLVPESTEEWCVNMAETELHLRQNAWWMNLAGADELSDVEKPTVILPRNQIFEPKSLSEIMNRVARREAL